MKAVVPGTKQTDIRDLPIPSFGDDEILIKNIAVAANPKDAKYPRFPIEVLKEYGSKYGFDVSRDDNGFMSYLVEGSDVAGYVVDVGKNITDKFKKGDKVAALLFNVKNQKYGGYAEYSVAEEFCVIKLDDEISFEKASTIPLGAYTAMTALYYRANITVPCQDSNEWIVIYGASSSVGSYAVQMAKLAGYNVVGIAGASGNVIKSEFEIPIIDYRNKTPQEVASDVKQVIGSGKVVLVLDNITTDDSVQIDGEILQPKGGKVYTLLFPTGKEGDYPNVEFERVLVWDLFKDSESHAFARKYTHQLEDWLSTKKLQPNRYIKLPDGLASVEKGLEMLRNGQVSGAKLVYNISDTADIAN